VDDILLGKVVATEEVANFSHSFRGGRWLQWVHLTPLPRDPLTFYL
jgi:hypothetical protein